MALGWINTECCMTMGLCLQLSEEKFFPSQIFINCKDGKKILANMQCLRNLPSRHSFLRSYHKKKKKKRSEQAKKQKQKFPGLREHVA